MDAVGGRKFELTKNQFHLAQSAIANRDTHLAQLCQELDTFSLIHAIDERERHTPKNGTIGRLTPLSGANPTGPTRRAIIAQPRAVNSL